MQALIYMCIGVLLWCIFFPICANASRYVVKTCAQCVCMHANMYASVGVNMYLHMGKYMANASNACMNSCTCCTLLTYVSMHMCIHVVHTMCLMQCIYALMCAWERARHQHRMQYGCVYARAWCNARLYRVIWFKLYL